MVVVEGAVPLRAVAGAVTRYAMKAGTMVSWDKLLMLGHPGFISAVLAPGMRAVTVNVDSATTSARRRRRADRILLGARRRPDRSRQPGGGASGGGFGHRGTRNRRHAVRQRRRPQPGRGGAGVRRRARGGVRAGDRRPGTGHPGPGQPRSADLRGVAQRRQRTRHRLVAGPEPLRRRHPVALGIPAPTRWAG